MIGEECFAPPGLIQSQKNENSAEAQRDNGKRQQSEHGNNTCPEQRQSCQTELVFSLGEHAAAADSRTEIRNVFHRHDDDTVEPADRQIENQHQHGIVEQLPVPVFLDGLDDKSGKCNEFGDARCVEQRRQRQNEQHIEDDEKVSGLEIADRQERAVREHLTGGDFMSAVGGVDRLRQRKLLEHCEDREHDALSKQYDPRKRIAEHVPGIVGSHICGAVDPEEHALHPAECGKKHQHAQQPVGQLKAQDTADIMRRFLIRREHGAEELLQFHSKTSFCRNGYSYYSENCRKCQA